MDRRRAIKEKNAQIKFLLKQKKIKKQRCIMIRVIIFILVRVFRPTPQPPTQLKWRTL